MNVTAIDDTSKIECSKIKKKITDIYRSTAPKTFSEVNFESLIMILFVLILVLQNFADFNKDNWIKVTCVHIDGLKSYRGEMFCPLCFKKLTPQNRSKAGHLPRWDLERVKGHVKKQHFEKQIAGEGNDTIHFVFYIMESGA